MTNKNSTRASGSNCMSCRELLDEIERLRSKMNSLAATGADYAEVLEISRKLDVLIVLFHKIAASDTC
ncbi:MAG: Spo0E like sporulation regulatory protein [Pelotomaculum sp. PtaB.Bin104]|nr:MAG: Spo0E like sporulation regulatory protein [Pelotomaculum sp. PtaB.Bin104]